MHKWFDEFPQINGQLASLSLIIYPTSTGAYAEKSEYKQLPPPGDKEPQFVLTVMQPNGSGMQSIVQLKPLFSSQLLIEGYYTVYLHIVTDKEGVSRTYAGITKQGWTSRWRQHVNAARNGSKYIFHEALRRNEMGSVGHQFHWVWAAGLSYEAAMETEEKLVDGRLGPKGGSLYPRGLNMIPGGFAGLAYLGKHGFKNIGPRQWEHRSRLLREFTSHCERERKPNPLMAARWRDDEYAKSIIFGNPNNFTQEQVDEIRYMASLGHPAAMIAELFRCDVRRVNQLLGGQTYSRV